MTMERYWVIGGDYSCLGFKALRDGLQQLEGPFEARCEAEAAWKRLSSESSSRATARFSIAHETIDVCQ